MKNNIQKATESILSSRLPSYSTKSYSMQIQWYYTFRKPWKFSEISLKNCNFSKTNFGHSKIATTFATAGQAWIARSATSLSSTHLVEQKRTSKVKYIFADPLSPVLFCKYLFSIREVAVFVCCDNVLVTFMLQNLSLLLSWYVLNKS